MSEERAGVEQEITSAVFAARWIMAPMYLGVIIALAFLTFIFCREVLQYIPQLISMTHDGALIMALSLVELTLAINLLLVILVMSYQSFIVNLKT
ncbi:MAG: YqhA family protein, partial [Pseudomonadota bacterium]